MKTLHAPLPRSSARRVALVALLASTALAPRAAHAGSNDESERRAAAQALFDAAVERMAQRDYEHACPKLEEVVRLQPKKVGAQLQLAGCYEAAGKLASAWTRYRTAADSAAAARDRREREARAKAAAIEPRLPRLTIVVADRLRRLPGLLVKRSDVEIGAAQWGDAIPVDPGDVELTASAPGKKPWRATVKLVSGQALSVAVPALEDDAPPPVTAAPPVAVAPVARPPAEGAAPAPAQKFDPDRAEPRPAARAGGETPVWVWAVGGAGIAALGAGTGFGVDGLSAYGSLKRQCGPGLASCPEGFDTAGENARKNRGLALFAGLGGTGVIAIGAAAVGLATAPKKAPAVGVAYVVPAVSPGGAGALVGGSF